MSSLLFKELATKGTIEKLETALTLSNILYARSADSSSQEAFLSTISDLLQEAIVSLKAPAPEPKSVQLKEITIKPAGDSNVCPCDDCMKSKPRKNIWTAERKAEHSAHLKGLWAAKKAAKAATIPL